jgi:hypothetical protein
MIFKELSDIKDENFQFRVLPDVNGVKYIEHKIISYNNKHYMDDWNLFQIIRNYNLLFFKHMKLYAFRYAYCIIKLEDYEEINELFVTRFLMNTRGNIWLDDSIVYNHNPSFRHFGDYDINSIQSPEPPPHNIVKVSLEDMNYPMLWSKSDDWKSIILDMRKNLNDCYGRPISQSTMFKNCVDSLDQINTELSINQLGLTS